MQTLWLYRFCITISLYRVSLSYWRYMSQNKLLYSNLKTTQYINLTRDLSWMNSKNHEHTDRDGHVLGYICNVKIHSDTAAGMTFFTAPNSWKMRNSFRKWHAYRDMMFKDAGVTESEKGRYGKTIRPYLDTGMHTSANVRDPKAILFFTDPCILTLQM